jgi:predicted nucleic acid-binding protein
LAFNERHGGVLNALRPGLVVQRIYLDSNVFIAFIKSDMGRPFRLMYRDVERFFTQAPKKHIIVLSSLAFKEMEKIVHYSREDTIEFFKERKIKTETIQVQEKDRRDAIRFRNKGIHALDALHAALAINSTCDILLTFNLKDFEQIKDQILVKEPTDLLV